MIKRINTPKRFRRARGNASIKAMQAKIEEMMGFPADSVRFVYPNGRKARSDATVAALRRHWEMQ